VKRVFLVAGEASGDLHGANLIRALHDLEPELVFEGLGGQRMAEAGMRLHFDLAGRAIMGFAEVIRSLAFIRRLFYETLNRIEQSRPDCLVLIDYPGFNIQLAKRVKTLGIPIVYYISPQVWAWKKRRIHTLAKLADKMLVILPFEAELYTRLGVDCTYVGHPLMDHINGIKTENHWPGKRVVGLLPGSREQEIRRIFPPMIACAKGIREVYPDTVFVTPCVDDARAAQIKILAGDFSVETAVGKTYDVLKAARFCMVASGTATLETALWGVPFVILYRVAPITYAIAKTLVSVEHIGMVNILAGKRIVPEFIQGEIDPDRVVPVALELIRDSDTRSEMIRELGNVKESLGGPGASARAAKEVMSILERKSRGGSPVHH
jgi:lipid-A-disaccharide synthase